MKAAWPTLAVWGLNFYRMGEPNIARAAWSKVTGARETDICAKYWVSVRITLSLGYRCDILLSRFVPGWRRDLVRSVCAQ
jgi:hypothetical protein